MLNSCHRIPLRYATLGLLTACLATTGLSQTTISVKSGLISFAEGQVQLAGFGSKPSGTSIHLQEKQRLLTKAGNAELFLTPVTVLRAGSHSDWEMISAKASNIVMKLHNGSGIVELLAKLDGVQVSIEAGDATVHLEHKGIYRFDAAAGSEPTMKVLKGKAAVEIAGNNDIVKSKRSVVLGGASAEIAKLPATETDRLQAWHDQRSSLMARSFQGSRSARGGFNGAAGSSEGSGSAFGSQGTDSIACQNGTPALLN